VFKSRVKKGVDFWCQNCTRSVRVPEGKLTYLECIEDGWLSITFTCPECNRFTVVTPDNELKQKMQELGIATHPWSVSDKPWPIIEQPQRCYRPRRTPRSYLPFDEVDVAHMVADMDTTDWWQQLTAVDEL